MNINILFIIALLAGYTGVALADALSDDGYVDRAPVISAEPIYATVRVSHPERECWHEEVEHRSRESPAGTLAGGIVGGVIGNQFGRGAGKAALTVAGGLLGASVGHDLSQEPERRYTTDERRCEVVNHYTDERRIDGYRVTYRYKGKTLVTHTDTDPGDSIPVHVAIDPIQ